MLRGVTHNVWDSVCSKTVAGGRGNRCAEGVTLVAPLWAHREPDFSSPTVRQLERLTHVELQRLQAPGEVFQGPDDGVLHLRRGPLTEFVMAQVGLQSCADAAGERTMGLPGLLGWRTLGLV